jgi:hypothetical protein
MLYMGSNESSSKIAVAACGWSCGGMACLFSYLLGPLCSDV